LIAAGCFESSKRSPEERSDIRASFSLNPHIACAHAGPLLNSVSNETDFAPLAIAPQYALAIVEAAVADEVCAVV
jgi:hypothetical protein